MPGRNGMGPQGMGQMTGRKMGVCAGNGVGRGFGYGGRGMGRGMRAGFAMQMPITPIAEKEMLTAQTEYLSQELEGLKKRLAELEEKES
ncbi:MAG TPA: DUF5320 domain-containing protein [Treponemataceae bacterium]|nr:DUF5320 domain-containing protein [Treponemataceae bacterium]